MTIERSVEKIWGETVGRPVGNLIIHAHFLKTNEQIEYFLGVTSGHWLICYLRIEGQKNRTCFQCGKF